MFAFKSYTSYAAAVAPFEFFYSEHDIRAGVAA